MTMGNMGSVLEVGTGYRNLGDHNTGEEQQESCAHASISS